MNRDCPEPTPALKSLREWLPQAVWQREAVFGLQIGDPGSAVACRFPFRICWADLGCRDRPSVLSPLQKSTCY